jgi:hypothetical protein
MVNYVVIKTLLNLNIDRQVLYHGTTWRSESNVNHFIYAIKHIYHVSYS